MDRDEAFLRAEDGQRRDGLELFGAATLVEQLDKQVIVCLRDGRSILGCLRSFDQYANIVLENAVERIVIAETFGDVPQGIFVIRGENVMILGEVDPSKEASIGRHLQQVSPTEIKRALKAQKADKEAFRRREKLEWPIQEDF
eukprot:Plantae.Rhodophyta-Purpureofilum_apyrenoidigerum.ctg18601.p1 GENE.Plantae.Rhodophyta-Purpureofilum_apyrenoidigerum.ctg18601~~Plantae.Rhodophyta-Purpureofilum_apyrenoidigerum.ctg18601.p1  ORF type:complete len:143 (-),score=31.95 Plantae.Rhodophyta-Purpureofilum_apyrenoidigerum.ctg18601:778-1206(-)